MMGLSFVDPARRRHPPDGGVGGPARGKRGNVPTIPLARRG